MNDVELRGVDFVLDEEQEEALRKESPKNPKKNKEMNQLIELVRKKSALVRVSESHTKTLEPPKPKEGFLSVTCKPKDCVVLVDKVEVGKTSEGELKDHVLPEGSVMVSASVKDYLPDKLGQEIDIVDGASIRVDFTFEVDPNARTAKAQTIHDQMIAALGGEAALKAARFFKARGTLEVRNKAGESTTWPFDTVVEYPSRARFDLTKNNKKFRVDNDHSAFIWRDKTPKNAPEFEEVVDALRTMLENHLTGTLELISAPTARQTIEKLEFSKNEDVVFRVEREAYRYLVRLNQELQPKEVLLESGGLYSGLRILFSMYEKHGAAYFPKETQVIPAGDGKRGIIVKFTTIEILPAGKLDEYFKRKGKERRIF